MLLPQARGVKGRVSDRGHDLRYRTCSLCQTWHGKERAKGMSSKYPDHSLLSPFDYCKYFSIEGKLTGNQRKVAPDSAFHLSSASQGTERG